MPNITYKELMETMQRNNISPQAGMPPTVGNRDELVGQAKGSDQVLQGLKSSYKQKLDAIAQMDQKLAGLYGDPTSNLYIEHAGARERAKSPALSQGYDEAGDINSQVKSRERDIEGSVDDAIRTYEKLKSVEEREVEKLKKETEKKSKKTTSETKKASDKKLKEIQAERKKLGLDITDKAKVYDDEARYYFLTRNSQFKKSWLRQMAEDDFPEMSDQGYSVEEIKSEYEKWKEKNMPKAKTEKQKMLDALEGWSGQ